MDPTLLLNIVLNSIAMLLGIPGNALIIMVYAAKQFRSSAHIFIMGLAVADLLICLIRPLDIFLGTPTGLNFYSNYKFWCKGLPVINGTTTQWSIYILALIAIDRYFAVCRPHNHAITPKRAAISIATSFLIAFMVNVPVAVVSANVDAYIFGIYVGKNCDPAAGPRWLFLMQTSVMYSLIFISLLIMIVLYTKVVIEVRRRTKVRPAGDAGNASTSVFTDAGSTIMTNTATNYSNGTTNTITKMTNSSSIDEDVQAPGSSRNNDTTLSGSRVNSVNNGASTVAAVTRDARATVGRGKTTKMLLLTTAIFMGTYLPTLGFNLVPRHILIMNAFTQKKILVTAFFIVRNLYVLNHVINPIIYGFINRRFREDCAKIIRRLKCN